MVIVKIIGGLGNQMFQYAAGRALAEKLGVELKLDVEDFRKYPLRTFSLGRLHVDAPLAAPEELVVVRGGWLDRVKHRDAPVRRTVKENHGSGYHPAVLASGDGTYLNGYWQSEWYFASIADRIRREFRLREPLSEDSAGVLERIRAQPLSVSLHVRRGDYVSDANTFHYHGFPGEEYTRAAMTAMRDELGPVRFFAFSDDPAWLNDVFGEDPDVEILAFNGDARDHEDMMLMSACSHHVIANSSFSWWAAWLDDRPGKKVIAPRAWFRDPALETESIIPEGWRQL